jgi:NADH-quinone oxidoreductase subunit M
MFAHGIMTGLFFALVGLVYEKAHSREIFKMGGFGRMMPGIATAFTVAGLASLGLPATAGFVAELLTFLGAWRSAHSWWLFPAVAGTFLTAVYVLRVAKQIFWGPPSSGFHDLPDARGPEWVALVVLVFVLVLFGMAPGLAIDPVDSATVPLLMRLGVLR